MTITHVANGAVARGTGAITPALPSGIQTNDILLLFIETAGQAASITNANGGTWTEVADSPQSVGTSPPTDPSTRLTVFWSRYNGTQGNPTVGDSGNHTVGIIAAFRGVIASGNPYDVTSGGTEATSDTSGSITGDTTTTNGCMIIAAITGSGDVAANGTTSHSAWANTDLANVTEIIDIGSTTGNGGTLGVARGDKETAGAYGATTVTLDTAGYKAFMTIALKPTVEPVVTLNTADNSTFNDDTPTLDFTGTDAQGDDIRYNIQIDTSSSFNSQSGSPLLDKVSGTDAGFANPDNGADTDPFTSGENIQFTVQAGNALNPGKYYWRVRGIDPSGSNTYGAWSATRAFYVFPTDKELSIQSRATIPTTNDGHNLTDASTSVGSSSNYTDIDTDNATRVEKVPDTSEKAYFYFKKKFGSQQSINIYLDAQGSVAGSAGGTEENTGLLSPGSSKTSMNVPDAGNLNASDDTYTTFDAVNDEAATNITNAADIPSGKEIIGIEVQVHAKISGSGINHSLFVNVGTEDANYGTGKTLDDELTTTEQTFTLGGNSDLWGRTWTPADFSLTNSIEGWVFFRCDALSAGISIQVDFVQMKVYYRDPAKNMKLDIWDDEGSAWESLQSSNSYSANTDTSLQGTKTTNLSKYFDASFWVTVRGYLDHNATFRVDRLAIESAAGGNNYQQACNETIVLVDTIVNKPGKNFTEALVLVDTLNRLTAKTASEVVTVNDVLSKGMFALFSEVITLVETFVKTPIKIFTEAVTLVETFTTQATLFRVYDEIITIADTLQKQTQRSFNEAIALVDTLERIPVKLLNEAITLVDTLTRSTTKTFSEIVALADTIAKQSQKTFDEVVTIMETLTRTPTKVLSEAVLLVDTRLFQTSKNLVEVITLQEVFTKVGTLFRSFDEIVVINDTITKARNVVYSEVVAVVDTIEKQTTKTFSEAVAVVDSLTKTTMRSLAETITLVDTIARSAAKTFTEAITIVDTFVRDLARTFLETITLADTILKGLPALVFNEVITLVDTFEKVALKVKEFLETITIVETLEKQTQKIFSEVVSIADTITRSVTKTFAEAITIVDTISKTAGRTFSEAITIVDTLVRQAVKVLTEALTVADSIVKSTTRAFAETITITDVLQKFRTLALSEVVVIADTFSKMAGKTFAEALAVVDTLSRSTTKLLTEVIPIVDTFSRVISLVRNEAIIINDTIIRLVQKTFSETISLVDTLTKTAQKTFAEVVTLVDEIINLLDNTKIFSEVITVTDSFNSITAKIFSEVINIVDSIQKLSSRLFSEAITIVDTFARLQNKILSEAITVLDSINRNIGRTFSEVVSVVDTIVTASIFHKTFNETVAVVDTFIRVQLKNLAEIVVIQDTMNRLFSLGRIFTESITIRDNDPLKVWLNGVSMFWRKTVKAATTWTKQAKSSVGTWIKQSKPHS